jgi:hypothetical protein
VLRADDKRRLLGDPTVKLILTAAILNRRTV